MPTLSNDFSVVVVRHPETKKWLAVDESKGRGWWLPAGHVEAGETFREAALRETMEEAGIRVKLVGILRFEHSVMGKEMIGKKEGSYARLRVVFFGEPEDPAAPVKSEPDEESNGAAWLTVDELRGLKLRGKLRGDELLSWAKYIEAGGAIHPLTLLARESDAPATPSSGEEGGGE